jgi:MoaA/NifB/PqqE/SkfB family radical SAM enzyme
MVSMQTGLSLSTPSTYYLVFGWRCDGKCRFCWMGEYKSPETLDVLPGEVLLRVLRETKELSGTGYNISVSGGEPLIYKPTFELLELAHQLSVNVGITTNGYHLNSANVERIMACNPFNINVSLESVDPAVNESIRAVPRGTAKTLKGIETVVEEKRRRGARTTVIVKPTITELNYRQLPDLVRYFGKDGTVSVNMQPLFPDKMGEPFWIKDFDDLGRVMEELVSLRNDGYSLLTDAETLRGFPSYFRKGPNQREGAQQSPELPPKRCSVGYRNMLIYPDGKVFLCQLVNKEIGNLHDGRTLSQMWHASLASKQRRAMLKCRLDCQLSCTRSTPLWTKVRAFLRTA